MERLSLRALDRLPAGIARPEYDIGAQRVGIVHLGIGAFHRAHQAVYLDDRLAAGESGWAICAASLRSPETRDALAPQDHLFTLAQRSAEGERLRVIGSVRNILVHREAPHTLLAAMTDPAVRIVSLTVTEKGYCHDPASGELNEEAEEIRSDLQAPAAPISVPGILVEALSLRRAVGTPPFTVLSCDNLPANGSTVRRVVARFATLREADLGKWIAAEVAFPSTMIDRIVPATTAADRERVAAALGFEDAWPVVCEPFSQWVVEDKFPQGRPRLDECGVELVSDVAPYEAMKLRLLNASHSAMAYLGYLAGYETIAETIAQPAFHRLVRQMMEAEAAPTLHLPPQFDLAAYRSSLLARFANPHLQHRTWQVAMDGSQKLPQRLLDTIRDRLRAGAPFPCLALAVAGWIRYVAGSDEKGRPIDVRDPLAARFKAIADREGLVAARLAPGLVSVREVFGDDLPRDTLFTHEVQRALDRIIGSGAADAVAGMVPRNG